MAQRGQCPPCRRFRFADLSKSQKRRSGISCSLSAQQRIDSRIFSDSLTMPVDRGGMVIPDSSSICSSITVACVSSGGSFPFPAPAQPLPARWSARHRSHQLCHRHAEKRFDEQLIAIVTCENGRPGPSRAISAFAHTSQPNEALKDGFRKAKQTAARGFVLGQGRLDATGQV